MNLFARSVSLFCCGTRKRGELFPGLRRKGVPYPEERSEAVCRRRGSRVSGAWPPFCSARARGSFSLRARLLSAGCYMCTFLHPLCPLHPVSDDPIACCEYFSRASAPLICFFIRTVLCRRSFYFSPFRRAREQDLQLFCCFVAGHRYLPDQRRGAGEAGAGREKKIVLDVHASLAGASGESTRRGIICCIGIVLLEATGPLDVFLLPSPSRFLGGFTFKKYIGATTVFYICFSLCF